MAMQTAVSRAPRPSGLADVLELILDKGLVIDAYVRVSLVGIELVTIDARIVVASVDTYLRFAEAVNRLDLVAQSDSMQLTDMFGDSDEDGDGRSQSNERSLGTGENAGGEERDQDQDDDSVSADESDRDRDDSARSEAADRDDEAEESDPGDNGARDRDEDEGDDDDQTGLFGKIRERGKVYE